MCFNSTLVQLKAYIALFDSSNVSKFQFYLSSIKSLYGRENHNDRNTFQFYLSSIKS